MDRNAVAEAAREVVGRSRELGRLREALDRSIAGQGRLILVSGEPGIGKTTLAEWLAAEAADRGAGTAWGACWRDDPAAPFRPWLQILRAFRRSARARRLAAEMDSGLRVEAGATARPSATQPEGDESRLLLFDRVTTFFRDAAERRPFVLVLDDLQRADTSSLMFLSYIARELRDSSLLVLGTYRDVEAGDSLRKILGELSRDTERIALGGLDESEVADLIARVSGAEPDAILAQAVQRKTGGNPFFVKEVVQFLAAGGPLAGVPEGVREIVGRRVSHLSASCAQILTSASIIGEEFDVRLLEEVVELPSHSLLDALDEATAGRIVSATAPGRYRFDHTLVREVLYESVRTAARIRLHRCVGEAIEHLYASELDAHVEELAYHFFWTASEADAPKAMNYSAAAAEHAMESLAYEDAAAHLERALDALALATPQDEGRRCTLLIRLAEARSRAGATGAARDTFLEAARLAKERGAAEELARAALGFGAEFHGYSGNIDEPLVALLEDALVALGESNDVLRAKVLARLAMEHFVLGSAEPSDSLSKEAMRIAQRVSDPSALLVALEARHQVLHRTGNVEDRLSLGSKLITLAEDMGDSEHTTWGRIRRVTDLLEVADMPTLDREVDRFSQLVTRLRQPSLLWFPRLWETMRALMDGRFEAAERLSQEALDIGLKTRREQALSNHAVQLFALRRAQGRLGEIEEQIRSALDRRPSSAFRRCMLAVLHADGGRAPAARAEIERLARDDFSELRREFSWLFAFGLCADVCTFLRDRAVAGRLYALLLPHEGRFAYVGYGSVCSGSMSRHLGMLAAVLGEFGRAIAHFDRALADHSRAGSMGLVGETQLDFASALIDAGEDHERAATLLGEATGIFRSLGMLQHEERARRLAEGAPRAPFLPALRPPAREATRPDASNLFRREGDYWTVVYRGTVVRLKDAKGLRDIAFLLANPGREVHVLDLVQTADPRSRPSSVINADDLDALSIAPLTSERPGSVVDARARNAYQSRIVDLQDEVEEAERFGDTARAARAREEQTFIARELASTYGIRRARTASDAVEKARKAVTFRIRWSASKIKGAHPVLGRHLARSLKTGIYCTYLPDEPIRWIV